MATGHSSLLPTQEAVWSALTASSAFTSVSAGPFDPAPTNQAMPYVAFGDHIETNWYSFGRMSKQIEFVMHVYSQQPNYAECMSILDAICSVIEGTKLSLPGGTFENVAIILLSASKLEEDDGLTRHIESRWKVWNSALT